MDDCIQAVYETILERRDHPAENSYTRYLFDQGIDKILKKVGEECAETIIAAKNGNNAETAGEICDLGTSPPACDAGHRLSTNNQRRRPCQ